MENIITSFIFEEGYIHGFNVSSQDKHVLEAMDFIETTLESTIVKNKLSGRLELQIGNDKIHVAYINIQPFRFAPVLIDLINNTL